MTRVVPGDSDNHVPSDLGGSENGLRRRHAPGDSDGGSAVTRLALVRSRTVRRRCARAGPPHAPRSGRRGVRVRARPRAPCVRAQRSHTHVADSARAPAHTHTQTRAHTHTPTQRFEKMDTSGDGSLDREEILRFNGSFGPDRE